MAPSGAGEMSDSERAAASVAVDEATEQKIQHCLRILKGKSDEHKFAGLLMVTKLNDLSRERLQQVRRQVVATVGVKFFLRLLHTTGEEGSLSSFQTLGLSLIASFCDDAAIAEAFAEEKLVRFLLEQLEALSSRVPQVQEDCFRILNGVVDTAKGQEVHFAQAFSLCYYTSQTCSFHAFMCVQLFLDESVLRRVFSSLKTTTNAVADAAENVNAAEETKRNDSEQDPNATIEALWSLIEKLARTPRLWASIHSDDLDFVCANFAHTCGTASLTVLAMLNDYMAMVEEGSLSFALATPQLDDIRAGVYRFLRSKWPHQERDACLEFISQLMRHTGTSWIVSSETNARERRQPAPSDVSGGKFILFVLKLVSIEVKLMLDDVEFTLVQMEEKKLEQVEETERQEKEIQRVLRVLPVCYSVVEMIIGALVASLDSEDDDSASMLPSDILLEMKQSFGQVFAVILEFLVLAREYMKTHRFRELQERSAASVYQLDAVVYASVRVVSAWIAEDSDSCMEQLVDLVPFLVLYEPLPHAAAAPPSGLINEEDSDVDSDDELDSDDEVNGMVMKSGAATQSGESNIDQLHFLLPGLLQISATPEGAKAMSDDLAVLRRLMRFCCTLCTDIADGTNEFGSLPTLTLALGMLINLLLATNRNDEEEQRTPSGGLPNATEWFRALSFLLPLACASGSEVASDKSLTTEDRGEDDRYVVLLHVACVILLISSHSDRQRERSVSSHRGPVGIANLVVPFNGIVSWLTTHPPDPSSESSMDLFELVRILSMRSTLTPQVLLQ